jgi:hypothetical protein
MRPLLPLSATALALLLVSCGGAGFKSISDLKKDLSISQLPTQADYPEDDAVMLDAKNDVEMKFTSSYDAYTNETVRRNILVLRNVEKFTEVEVPIWQGEKIKSIEARTLKPDGRVIELKETDFHTITGQGDGSVFYSDASTIRFAFQNVEKGDVLQYTYVKTSDNPFISDIWSIQYGIPTIHNSYTVALPRVLLDATRNGGAGLKWQYKAYNYNLPQPVVNTGGKIEEQKSYEEQQARFSWTVANVPGFKTEPMMPAEDQYRAYVKFAPPSWSSWNNVASWYYRSLFEPQLVLGDDIRALSSELTAGATTEREKIRRLYSYVQGLRYVAIALGDGGLRPSKPSEVLARKYGDCKDKSILLISLLKSAGITAHPILVLTGDEGRVDPKFVNWNFNHMIVRADTKSGEEIWIDPTATTVRLGELPWTDEGVDVLVLNDDGTGTIERTPQSSAEENVTDIDIDAEVASSGETVFHVRMEYTGERNGRYRHYFRDRSEKQLSEYFKSLVAEDFVNATIRDFSVSNIDSIDAPLRLQFSFTAPNAIQQQGDLHMLNVDPFKTTPSMDWLAKESRTFPVEFIYPEVTRKKIRVKYPAAIYTVRNLPRAVSQKSGTLAYTTSFRNDTPGEIVAEETYTEGGRYVVAKLYPDLRQFYLAVSESSKERLILAKK